jgi:hypothetical protein
MPPVNFHHISVTSRGGKTTASSKKRRIYKRHRFTERQDKWSRDGGVDVIDLHHGFQFLIMYSEKPNCALNRYFSL